MRALLAVLLLAPAAARAAPAESCVELKGVGCVYAPSGSGGSLPLLVYLRGHHPRYAAAVPAGEALASARQAFSFYGLGDAADAAGHAVLVTYRSGLAVTEADAARAASAAGVTFTRRVVAAHSGGYVGLGATLAGGLSFERVIMLDDFYSSSPALAQQVQARFPADACMGYYTPHIAAVFEAVFRPNAPGCRVERLGPNDHNAGVNRCLAGYLRGRPCSSPR
ncbi:MAG: hypothetical protein SF051_09225 [Elusimicrobiota bacterium]|nr:hypothetical protein [Elusimicrobiota bacterium]